MRVAIVSVCLSLLLWLGCSSGDSFGSGSDIISPYSLTGSQQLQTEDIEDTGRFAVSSVGARVAQPPVVCPNLRIRTLSTLFLTRGGLSPLASAVKDLMQSLVSMYTGNGAMLSGSGNSSVVLPTPNFASFSLTDSSVQEGPWPDYSKFDIVVYWDDPPQGSTSTLDFTCNSLTGNLCLSNASCTTFGNNFLKAWYRYKVGREVVFDARARSLATESASGISGFTNPYGTGALSSSGRAELVNEWLALATASSGGLLVLAHPSSDMASRPPGSATFSNALQDSNTVYCVNSLLTPLGFRGFAMDAPQQVAGLARDYAVSNLAANERSTLLMCPLPALSVMPAAIFGSLGRNSRYTASRGAGGGLVLSGGQPNGLQLNPVAFWGDDPTRPALSSSVAGLYNALTLQAKVITPVIGGGPYTSCTPITFIMQVQVLSGKPPYLLQWLDTLLSDGESAFSTSGSSSSSSSSNSSATPSEEVIAIRTYSAANSNGWVPPLNIPVLINLRPGTHRVIGKFSDAEGSRVHSAPLIMIVADINAAVKADLAGARASLSLRQDVLKSTSDKIRQQKDMIDNSTAYYTQLMLSAEDEKASVNATETQVAAVSAQVGDLQGKIDAYDSLKSSQTAALAMLRSETNSAERLMMDNMATMQSLQDTLDQRQDDASTIKALYKQLSDLTDTQGALATEAAKIEQQTTDAKNQLKAANDLVDQARLNMTNSEDDLKRQITSAKKDLSLAKHNLTTLLAAQSAANDALATAQSDSVAATAALPPLQAQAEALRQNYEAQLSQSAASKAALAAADDAVCDMEDTIFRSLMSVGIKWEETASVDAVSANATLPSGIAQDLPYLTKLLLMEARVERQQELLRNLTKDMQDAQSEALRLRVFTSVLDDTVSSRKNDLMHAQQKCDDTAAALSDGLAQIASLRVRLDQENVNQGIAKDNADAMQARAKALAREKISLARKIAEAKRDEARWQALLEDLQASDAISESARNAKVEAAHMSGRTA